MGCVATVLSVFLCFYGIGAYSFWRTDEVTHVKVTQEMALDGHWLSPTISGVPYFNKPPLRMWLSAALVRLFGESNFIYRLPNAIFGVGTLFFVYALGRRMFGSAAGTVAVFALLSSHTFFFVEHGVRFAVQDPGLIFFVTLALWYGWDALESLKVLHSSATRQTRSKQWGPALYAMGICSGLAVLTKSVLGLYAFYVWLVTAFVSDTRSDRRERFLFLLKLLMVPGAIAILLPALYFVPHLLFSPSAYQVMVNDELITRVSAGYHHQDEPLFYVRLLLRDRLVIAPEALLIALGTLVLHVFRNRLVCIEPNRRVLAPCAVGPAFREEVAGTTGTGGEATAIIYCTVWGLSPLVFFSLIPSRLPWYISVGLPGLALIVGAGAAFCFRGSRGFIFILAAALSIAWGIEKNVSTALTQRRTVTADLLARAVRSYNNAHREPLRVVVEDSLVVGRRELVYLYGLRPTALPRSKILEKLRSGDADLALIGCPTGRVDDLGYPFDLLVLPAALGRTVKLCITNSSPSFGQLFLELKNSRKTRAGATGVSAD